MKCVLTVHSEFEQLFDGSAVLSLMYIMLHSEIKREDCDKRGENRNCLSEGSLCVTFSQINIDA